MRTRLPFPLRQIGRGAVVAMLLLVQTACAPLPFTASSAVPWGDQEQGTTGMPPWNIGDHWVYDDGYDLEVTEVNGDLAKFVRLDEHGRWMQRRGLFTVASFDGDKERKLVSSSGTPASLFPLAPGKSATLTKRYLAGGEERVHQQSWLVEGRESITVPAGTFDCWVIFFTSRSLQSDWRSFERWWYSPEINHYVRMDYQYADSPVASRKLLSYLHGETSAHLAEKKTEAAAPQPTPLARTEMPAPLAAVVSPSPPSPPLRKMAALPQTTATVDAKPATGFIMSERQGRGKMVYWVHVGSFKQQREQERVIVRLRDKLPLHTGQVMDNGKPAHQVQVGPFATMQKAEIALAQVNTLLAGPATPVAKAKPATASAKRRSADEVGNRLGRS